MWSKNGQTECHYRPEQGLRSFTTSEEEHRISGKTGKPHARYLSPCIRNIFRPARFFPAYMKEWPAKLLKGYAVSKRPSTMIAAVEPVPLRYPAPKKRYRFRRNMRLRSIRFPATRPMKTGHKRKRQWTYPIRIRTQGYRMKPPSGRIRPHGNRGSCPRYFPFATQVKTPRMDSPKPISIPCRPRRLARSSRQQDCAFFRLDPNPFLSIFYKLILYIHQ